VSPQDRLISGVRQQVCNDGNMPGMTDCQMIKIQPYRNGESSTLVLHMISNEMQRSKMRRATLKNLGVFMAL